MTIPYSDCFHSNCLKCTEFGKLGRLIRVDDLKLYRLFVLNLLIAIPGTKNAPL